MRLKVGTVIYKNKYKINIKFLSFCYLVCLNCQNNYLLDMLKIHKGSPDLFGDFLRHKSPLFGDFWGQKISRALFNISGPRN